VPEKRSFRQPEALGCSFYLTEYMMANWVRHMEKSAGLSAKPEWCV